MAYEQNADQKKLAKEAEDRLQDCRKQKNEDSEDIEEAYFFVAPRRSRDITSENRTKSRQLNDDAGELQTDLGIECAQDFATFMLNTFLPEELAWAQRDRGVDVPEPIWSKVKAEVEQSDKNVFDAIRASDFRSASAEAFETDLPIGTIGMWIEDEVPYAPVSCRPVPIRELEINVGPDGKIDDRFVVKHVKYRQLPRLLGSDLPKEIQECIDKKPTQTCTVKWGFWRLWDRHDDVVWQGVVIVDKKVIASSEYIGAGSCPLIVARFSPDSMFAFGEGPAIKALPTLRTLDEAMNTIMDRWDIAVNPPWTFDQDGILNFEGGIQSGMAYPKAPGSGDPKGLYFEGDTDFAFFTEADMERRIRRLFYVDEPVQRGDTPPTATQWYEETLRAQRRIGMPGQIFWREYCAEVFMRFDYILQMRGVNSPIAVDGKSISLTPQNPATRAAELQDVETAVRFNQTAATLWQQEFPLVVDGLKTMLALQEKMGDKLTVFRTPEEIEQRMQQMAAAVAQEQGGDVSA